MYFMKNIVMLIFMLSLLGCSSLQKREWNSPETISKNRDRIEVGDILVKEKLKYPITSWFGHCAVKLEGDKIGGFPGTGRPYTDYTFDEWLNEPNRKIVVLRYPYFKNPKFREKFLENAKKYGKGMYKLQKNKTSTDGFYCSQFVWYLYYKTAKDLGYNLDIDGDKGIAVFPYDFFKSKDLQIVNMR